MVFWGDQALSEQAVAAKRAKNAGARQAFLHDLQAKSAQLSNSAVELVAALVAVQSSLPQALSAWLLAELGQRADLNQVLLLASDAMKIGLHSSLMHTCVELGDSSPDFALICLLGRNAALVEARLFLAQLVQSLERWILVHTEMLRSISYLCQPAQDKLA